jgi:hypothetical protein
LYVIACSAIAGKQLFYFSPQLGIIAASLIQQADALLGLALRSAMEQILDLRPAFRGQVAPIRSAFP